MCLPCLNPVCAQKNGTRQVSCLRALRPFFPLPTLSHPAAAQDADSLCSVCYSDNLAGQPSVELKCGHFFHFDCTRRQLESKWIGARVRLPAHVPARPSASAPPASANS